MVLILGKEVKSEETFGALPIHVRGHAHIYDGLDAAMDNNEIKTNDDNSAGSSSQEVLALTYTYPFLIWFVPSSQNVKSYFLIITSIITYKIITSVQAWFTIRTFSL